MAAAPAELYRLWRGNDNAKPEAFSPASSQMEANLEASDLTAIELLATYLKAFHNLIALDSSSTFLLCRVRVFFLFLPITGLKRWVKAKVKLSL